MELKRKLFLSSVPSEKYRMFTFVGGDRVREWGGVFGKDRGKDVGESGAGFKHVLNVSSISTRFTSFKS
jgi:hypothetical protein